MSTYIYLECLDHNPPLRAEDESGQHLYDLPRIRAELADRQATALGQTHYSPMSGGHYDMGAYFQVRSTNFLAAHPTCRIGIRDEYGIDRTTDKAAK